jgi:hypothetical protein
VGFDAADGDQVEKYFSGARFVEDAVINSGRAGVEKFRLDKGIFFVEGVEQPLDIFDARRGVPDQRTFFLGAFDEFGRMAVLGRDRLGKHHGKHEQPYQDRSHVSTAFR